ncbi:hypothetical protein ACJ73_06696 [Blastomyces percursus]|uniref:Uncharacterized protein n=1 Tax=Blastomyces percursus TaxID=1658174 RepID=A0A1J9Q1H6_9EURO|nr:hypothetical protein ACJ73_06696 [Blastomyces percursus]
MEDNCLDILDSSKHTAPLGNTSRSTLQCHGFVHYRGNNIGRLVGLFVHEIVRGAKRMFAVLIPIESQYQDVDSILNLPVYRMNARKEIIVGLPSLGWQRQYMIPVEYDFNNRGHQDLKMAGNPNKAEAVIHYTWDIDFY